jgi:hypothetical protein
VDEPAATFQEAAILRGLVEDEEEYRKALSEACDLRMPGPLRNFFAHMLLNCGVSDGLTYWEEFKAGWCLFRSAFMLFPNDYFVCIPCYPYSEPRTPRSPYPAGSVLFTHRGIWNVLGRKGLMSVI